MSNGHLFCKACREQLSLKRSIITNHIKSTKHSKSRERLKFKHAREENIAESLNSETHLRGETLPEEMQVYCITVFVSIPEGWGAFELN